MQVFSYVQKMWIESSMWGPSAWTVYNQAIRTNNDIEGWHAAINRSAQTSNLPFYKLVILLYETSQEVTMNIRLISERKLKRYQRIKYRQLQQQIFKCWQEFEEGDLTAKQLLDRCAHMYGNAPVVR